MARTKMSTKGQVVIPKAVREDLAWRPGTMLELKVRAGELVLRPASPFPPTTLAEVVGSVPYRGPPITVTQMDEAIARMFRERWTR